MKHVRYGINPGVWLGSLMFFLREQESNKYNIADHCHSLNLNKEYDMNFRDLVAEKVLEITREQLDPFYKGEYSEDKEFVKDLECDSLDQVEIVMAIEEEFKTDFPDSDLEKCVTVKDMIDMLVDKLK